jgi:hypothetical protein
MARALIVVALLSLAAGSGATQATAPIWPKPDLFWYRKSVQGGYLWLKVDAEHGVREPLFDHQRLAIELSLRTGLEFTPLTLPFADPDRQFVVKYDGSNAYIQEGAMAIEFIHEGYLWRCDLQIKWDWNRVPPTDYECLSRRPVNPDARPASSPDARPSPDGQWQAFIEDHNVAIRPAGATAGSSRRLSTDGTATDAYHLGSLRWSADSKTLSAYRVHEQVWTSDALAGTVKSQVVKRSWTVQ